MVNSILATRSRTEVERAATGRSTLEGRSLPILLGEWQAVCPSGFSPRFCKVRMPLQKSSIRVRVRGTCSGERGREPDEVAWDADWRGDLGVGHLFSASHFPGHSSSGRRTTSISGTRMGGRSSLFSHSRWSKESASLPRGGCSRQSRKLSSPPTKLGNAEWLPVMQPKLLEDSTATGASS